MSSGSGIYSIKGFSAARAVLVVAFLFLAAYSAFSLPSVSFVPPTLNDSSVTGAGWVFVNVSSTEPLNQSLLEWGNSSGYSNLSMLNASGSNWYLNVTNLSDGNYNYSVWAQNLTGDWNRSETRFVTLDAAAPSILFTDPTPNNSVVTGSTWAYLNASVSDFSNATAFIDWNRSLVGWWRFNREAGENDTLVRDWSSYGNNGTMLNMNSGIDNCTGNCSGWTASGKFGRGITFEGLNGYVDAGNANTLKPNLPVTISAWIKDAETGVARGIFANDRRGTAVHSGVWLQLGTSDIIDIGYGDNTACSSTGRRSKNGTTVISPNTWYYLVAVINGATNMSIYVNGVDDGGTYAGTGGNLVYTTRSATIGVIDDCGSSNEFYFNGTIDEVRIWSRALSGEEINASYNSGLYRLYRNFTSLADGTYSYLAYAQDALGDVNQTDVRNLTVDASPPGVLLVSPPNNSAIQAGTLINFTLSDASSIDSAWWSNDSGISNFSLPPPWDIDTAGWPEGAKSIDLWANDSIGNVRRNSYSFTLDQAPSVSFADPTPNNSIVTSSNWAYLNVSILDSSNTTAFIDWNRSLVGWWRFNNESGENSTFFRDWSSWGNNGSCGGSSCPGPSTGRFGSGLLFDGANDYLSARNTASLNVSGNNLTLEAWIYYLGGNIATGSRQTVISKYNSTSFIIDLPDDGGTEGYRFYVNGTFAKWNTTPVVGEWTHLVGVYNSTRLLLYVNGVEKASISKTGNIGVSNAAVSIGSRLDGGPNYFFNGTIDEVRVWNRALSPAEVNASYNSGLYLLYRNFTSLTSGNYSFRAYAQDLVGNVNSTGQRMLAVDVSPPALSIESPLNASYGTVSLWFNVSASDTSGVSSCVYSIDDGSNVSMSNDTPSHFYSMNSSVPEGPHNATFFCNDTLGNAGAANRSFLIDLSPPFFSNVQYGPYADVDSPAVIRVNASAISGLDSVFLEENSTGGWLNRTMFLESGASLSGIYNYSLNFSSLGSVSFRFYANTTYGRWNLSQSYGLLVQNVTVALGLNATVVNASGPLRVTGSAFLQPNGSALLNNSMSFWLDNSPLGVMPATDSLSLQGWLYARQITVDNTAGPDNLSGFPVPLNVTFDPKMRAGFEDLRFAWYNRSSQTLVAMPYWLESRENGSSAYVWFKVPSISAYSNETVYLYYGNPSAEPDSNGTAVFDLFDDFDNASLDGSRWAAAKGGISYSVSGSVFRAYGTFLSNATGDGGFRAYSSIGSYGLGYAFRGRFKVVSQSKNALEVGWGNRTYPNSTNSFSVVDNTGGNSNESYVLVANSSGESGFVFALGSSYYVWDLARLQNQSHRAKIGSLDRTFSSNTTGDPMPVTLGVAFWDGATDPYDYYAEWVLVRKYSPYVSASLGSEFNPVSTNSTGGFSYSFPAPLEAGTHVLSVNVTDPNGIYGVNSTTFLQQSVSIRQQNATGVLTGTGQLLPGHEVNVSALVYRSLDGNISNAWINVTSPDGTNYTYQLSNANSTNETGVWFRILNVSWFGDLLGGYVVRFYSNDTSGLVSEYPPQQAVFLVQNTSITEYLDRYVANPSQSLMVWGQTPFANATVYVINGNNYTIESVSAFNDSSYAKNVSLNASVSRTEYIRLPKRIEVLSASFDVRGFQYNNSYPLNPYVDIGGNGNDDFWGLGWYRGSVFVQDRFNDSLPYHNVSFYLPDYDLSGIKLPKSLSLMNATLNVSGRRGTGFSSNSSQSLATNGNFETGDFTGWSSFSIHLDTNATGQVKNGSYAAHFTSTYSSYSAVWQNVGSMANKEKFITFWYYPVNLSTGDTITMPFVQDGMTVDYTGRRCGIAIMSSTSLRINIRQHYIYSTVTNPMNSSRWYKIQLYCNPAVSIAKAWVDGVYLGSATSSSFTESGSGLWLGDPWASPGGYGSAYFDDLIINAGSTTFLPDNVTLNLGNDNSTEWSSSGPFNSSVLLDVSSEVASYFDSCTASTDSRGNRFCNIPLNVTTQSAGNVSLYPMNVTYNYSSTQLSAVYADYRSAITSYLSSCTEDSEGYCNVPLVFRSEAQGALEVSNINITYVAGYLNRTLTNSSGNYSATFLTQNQPGAYNISVFMFKSGESLGNATSNLTVLANTTFLISTYSYPLDVDSGVFLWAYYQQMWDSADVNSTFASVNLSVWNSTGGLLLGNVSMPYNSSMGRWEYWYNLSALGILNYTISASSWEYVNGQPMVNKTGASSLLVQNVSILLGVENGLYWPEFNLTIFGTVLLLPNGTGLANNTISVYVDGSKLLFDPSTGVISSGGNETIRANSSGVYNYTLGVPLEGGTHVITVNASDPNGIFGESSSYFPSLLSVRHQAAVSPATQTSHVNTAGAVRLYASVFRNLDGPIDYVWVNLSFPNSTSRVYYLGNSSSPLQTQNWSVSINVSLEFGGLLGRYNASFYANSTLANGSLITQELPAPESYFYVQNLSVSAGGSGRVRPSMNLTVYGSVLLNPDEAGVLDSPVSFWLSGNLTDWCWSGIACLSGNGTYVSALNGTWRYVRQVAVNNSANPEVLSYYQVRVNVTYDAGMQPAFGDVRFAWYNRTSGMQAKVPYWIENKSDGEWASVWVRVPEIAGSERTTIYLYYGNVTAPSESNATAVFDFFDDFESGSLSSYTTGGSSPWRIATDSVYQGTYSAGSDPAINDSQHSWMQRSFTGPGLVEFYDSVSSENNYDYLRFSVNGVSKQSISGSVGWTRRNYTSGSGDQLLRWNYTKDGSVSSGSDRGWIDNLRIRKYYPPEPAAILGPPQPVALTDPNGSFSYVLVAPQQEGNYILKVNITDINGIYGEAELAFTVDNTPPALSILSPLNSTYPSSVWFNVSMGEPGDWCGYSLDGGANVSMLNDSASHFYNRSVLSEGAHNVSFYCNDTAGNVGNSSFVYFTADASPPAVSVQVPANLTYPAATIGLNFTVSDNTAVSSCRYELNGANASLPGCQNTTIAAVEGNNTIRVWANDTVNNWGVSSPVSFAVDTFGPGISVQSPANGTYASANVDLNFTVADPSGISHCKYGLNGVNATLPGCLNTTITALEGNNTLLVWANDTVGNWNVSPAVYFTVDATPPAVAIQSPSGQAYASGSIGLNYTAWDLSGVSQCKYELDGGANVSLAGCSNSTLSGLSQGGHSLKVWANDTLNNWNFSGVSFSVDSEGPAIVVQYPQNTTYPASAVGLNYTVGDASGVSVCKYELNWVNTTLPGCQNSTISGAEGGNSVRVWANDTLGNWNVSVIVSFSVDTAPPLILVQSPQNTTYPAKNLALNFTVWDLGGVSSCKYELINSSGSFNISLPNCQNATVTATEGGNSLTVWANDSLGNWNFSQAISFAVDTAPPSLAIQSPLSQSYNRATIDLNFTAGDASGISLCRYELDGGANQTLAGCSNATLTSLGQGNHSVKVWANDTLNNWGVSGIVSFTVDTLGPMVSVQSPVNGSYSYANVDLNYTVSDPSGLSLCRYELDGASNVSLSGCSNSTLTSLGQGNHSVRVWANDTLNNWNSSATLSFTVDSLGPLVVLQSPANVTYASANISLNFTVFDLAGVSSCKYGLNGVNNSLPICLNATITALEGNNALLVWANDSLGNWNSSATLSFSVDTTPPAVAVQSPANVTYAAATVSLNYTVWDLSGISQCKYELDGGANQSLVGCANSTLSGLSQGNHTVRVWANDSVNNWNASVQVSFTVDTIGPSVSIQYPVNTGTYTAVNLSLNYTAGDPSGLSGCKYELDGGANQTLAGCANATLSSLGQGSHSVKVWANDTLNNWGVSSVSFSVDSLGPFISVQSPADTATYGSRNVSLNYTASDQSGVSVCSYELDGSANVSLASCGNATLTDLSDGGHLLRLWANDSLGNLNVSWWVSFAVDPIPPAFSFASPPSGAVVNVSYVFVNVTSSEPLSSAVLEWNGSNMSMSGSGTNWFLNGTGLGRGNYSFRVFGNDSVGNWNVSGFAWVFVDVSRSFWFNFSLVNVSGGIVENASLVVYNSSGNYSVFALNGSRLLSLEEGGLYRAAYLLPSNLSVVFGGISASGEANVSLQYVSSFAGSLPAYTSAVSSLVVLNASGLAYSNAEVILPLSGSATDVLFCPAWNYSGSCPAWVANSTSDYNASLVNSSLVFNVSSFGAYLAGYYYVPPPPPPSGGPGGGGGGGAAVPPSGVKSFAVSPGLPIVRIVVNLKREIIGPGLGVIGLNSSPVASPAGIAYYYFNATRVGFNASDVANVTFEFRVNRSWADANGVERIYLARHSDGWSRLEGVLLNSSAFYKTYRSVSYGLSYFAILGEPKSPPLREEEIPVVFTVNPRQPAPNQTANMTDASLTREDIVAALAALESVSPRTERAKVIIQQARQKLLEAQLHFELNDTLGAKRSLDEGKGLLREAAGMTLASVSGKPALFTLILGLTAVLLGIYVYYQLKASKPKASPPQASPA